MYGHSVEDQETATRLKNQYILLLNQWNGALKQVNVGKVNLCNSFPQTTQAVELHFILWDIYRLMQISNAL